MIDTTAAERRILVAATNVEDARLVAELLRDDFEHIETTSDPNLAVGDFEALRPQILVLAFKTLEEAERFYLGLYRLSERVHAIPHRTLVMCHRNDAFRAYELCRKQHFDDYVVFWPINYDPYRVRMAVLLAARAGEFVPRDGPRPVEFAAQARRIAELESLLQQSMDRGDSHISEMGDSLRRIEADASGALEGFSQRMTDDAGEHGPGLRDPAAFERELRRLRELAIQQPFADANAALDPVRQWAQALRMELGPRLQPARELMALAERVRPLVLLVDDDEFQHRLLRQMLPRDSIDLVFAGSGTEALAQLRTRTPDLILMDFQLPDATGVEITRRLKASPATAGIPVILITGTSTREVLAESHKAGAVDFMVKPIDGERVLARINRHLYGTDEGERRDRAPQ